ncbi:MAG: hypothetical protein ABIH08_07815 [Candidatus Omnitrophota bacterium]
MIGIFSDNLITVSDNDNVKWLPFSKEKICEVSGIRYQVSGIIKNAAPVEYDYLWYNLN